MDNDGSRYSLGGVVRERVVDGDELNMAKELRRNYLWGGEGPTRRGVVEGMGWGEPAPPLYLASNSRASIMQMARSPIPVKQRPQVP